LELNRDQKGKKATVSQSFGMLVYLTNARNKNAHELEMVTGFTYTTEWNFDDKQMVETGVTLLRSKLRGWNTYAIHCNPLV
jgi:hypothetical protein